MAAMMTAAPIHCTALSDSPRNSVAPAIQEISVRKKDARFVLDVSGTPTVECSCSNCMFIGCALDPKRQCNQQVATESSRLLESAFIVCA